MNIEKQFFYAAEFEQAESWLSYMHGEGWRFVSTDGWRYTFEPCEPEEWVYQLDFWEERQISRAYLKACEDRGWEFVTVRGRWLYFRKKKTTMNESENLFADAKERLERIERVQKGTVKKAMPWFLLWLLFQFLVWGTPLTGIGGAVGVCMKVLAVVLLAAATFAFFIYINQLDRLQKLREKLDQNKNE
ncbi:MAG: DUF2812 domain-containing protein [Lachnospiraceae bacterium]|nr:DUF2812 domain-containing protein [Lachnospiraceae bacterium]